MPKNSVSQEPTSHRIPPAEEPTSYYIPSTEYSGSTQTLLQPGTIEEHKDEHTPRPTVPTILVTSPSPSPTRQRKRRASSLDSDQNTEAEASNRDKMPSKKHSSEKHSSKSKPKSDDWTEVTEPEERRRIQNRIAQRKFREKTKEQKERAERESRNQEHAGGSYHIPDPGELDEEEGDLSGLPWGGLNVRHVMTRGHETEESRRSGGSHREGGNYTSQYYQNQNQYASENDAYYQQYQQHQTPTSYGSGDSGVAEDHYYDDGQALYSQYYHLDPNAGGSSQQQR